MKKEETESDSQEATKVENDDETQGAEQASGGSSWWGMDYSSLLNKAVNTVTTATSNAAELAKQKVSFIKIIWLFIENEGMYITGVVKLVVLVVL